MASNTGSNNGRLGAGNGASQGQDPCAPRPGDVRGIILAGVHAWGQSALEDAVCRPLLPVAGRPLIGHVIDWLRQGGVKKAYICANSNTRILRHRLGDGASFDMSLQYYEDDMPRGPAGCARDTTIAGGGELFVVAEGTIIPRIDLGKLLESHVRSKAVLTMAMAGSGRTGNCQRAALEPVGIYVFSREAFEEVPAAGYQDIKETLIPRLHKAGKRVDIHAVTGDSAPRVSGAESYLTVNRWAVQQAAGKPAWQDDYVRVGEGWVHVSAAVDPSARLVGPVIIGPGCVIDAGAIIVGPTTLGAECVVADRAVISRSVVWERCFVAEGAILDHCVLTDEAQVEPHEVVRNAVLAPRRRGAGRVLDRLAACCWPAHKRNGAVKRAPSQPVRTESDAGLEPAPAGEGSPPAVAFAVVEGPRLSSPVQAESQW